MSILLEFWNALISIPPVNGILILIYVTLIIVACVVLLAWTHKRCLGSCIGYRVTGTLSIPNDNAKPFALLFFAFCWLDWITDVAWLIQVYSVFGLNETWTITAAMAIIIPYITNLTSIFLFLKLLKFQTDYPSDKIIQSGAWLRNYSKYIMACVVLTGNGIFPILTLFNSQIFNLDIFSMKLRYRLLNHNILWLQLILNCFFETIPKFALQVAYFHSKISKNYGSATIIATLLSSISVCIIMVQLLYLIFWNGIIKHKKMYKDRIRIKYQFSKKRQLLSSNINYHLVTKQCFGMKHRITKDLALSVKNLDTVQATKMKVAFVCQHTEYLFHKNCVCMTFEMITTNNNFAKLCTCCINSANNDPSKFITAVALGLHDNDTVKRTINQMLQNIIKNNKRVANLPNTNNVKVKNIEVEVIRGILSNLGDLLRAGSFNRNVNVLSAVVAASSTVVSLSPPSTVSLQLQNGNLNGIEMKEQESQHNGHVSEYHATEVQL